MSVNFTQKAIDVMKRATQADRDKDYPQAIALYDQGIQTFMTALKYEKNKQTVTTIKEKMNQYMDRWEQLKKIMEQEKNGKKPTAEGANGPAKEDEESKKFASALDSAIVREKPNVHWDEVVGLEKAKGALKEAVIFPIKYAHVFVGKRKPWKGILMYGPPGTGKSYLAKAVATEVDSTFFSVSSSDLVSKWLGESEKLVRTLFEMARDEKPSIVFIDEIDSLAGNRSENESESARRIKTEFLVQMQGVGKSSDGVLVLGATNIPWCLDPAIRRRFEKRIYIPLPESQARAQMFKVHLGDTPHTLTDMDFQTLAAETEGYSGSDISVVVRDAIMEPVRKLTSEFVKPVAPTAARPIDPTNPLYEPCSPGDPQAVRIDTLNVKPSQITTSDVSLLDFVKAIKSVRPSVSDEDLRAHEKFTADFGSEGA